ncbi:Scr1 family TA system antitoxin-like transcriptional regulator [Nocardia fluminea]|uniref:Scr1 family TA system antitoxin-like transcriptional regulator n=1 Tax=Nocardia fluminea TaxID=134984 RepID=UPI003407F303
MFVAQRSSINELLLRNRELLDLESVAHLIRCYEPAVVPELLQTPEYARAAMRLAYPGHREAEIDRLLTVRLRSRIASRMLRASVIAANRRRTNRAAAGGADLGSSAPRSLWHRSTDRQRAGRSPRNRLAHRVFAAPVFIARGRDDELVATADRFSVITVRTARSEIAENRPETDDTGQKRTGILLPKFLPGRANGIGGKSNG